MFRTNNKKAFTLIELLVVISIIALLLSILMPALSKVKKQGKKVACASNLHQMHIALNAYASDWDYKYPPHDPIPGFQNTNIAQHTPHLAFWLSMYRDPSGNIAWESEFHRSYLSGMGERLVCPGADKVGLSSAFSIRGGIWYNYFGNYRGDVVGINFWLDTKERDRMPEKASDPSSWALMSDLARYGAGGSWNGAWWTSHAGVKAYSEPKQLKNYGYNMLRNGGDVAWDTIDVDIRDGFNASNQENLRLIENYGGGPIYIWW
ncbi:MAG: hypothetical protein DRP56_05460 [Planctomycetota bacterium]|nr:MAG: hypothetical protein DRP56_05460 [Planctomycetota bacterium]